MTAMKTTSTIVFVRDDHVFKGGAEVDYQCLQGLCQTAFAPFHPSIQPWLPTKQWLYRAFDTNSEELIEESE